MGAYSVFLWRDWLVFKQNAFVYTLYSVIQPFLLLYGMALAFQEQNASAANYLVPGFLVYTATASTFMGAAYNLYEHITTHRVSSWCAATVSLRTVLLANALYQTIRAFTACVAVLIAAALLIPDMAPHHLASIAGVLVLFSMTSAFWGSVVATWAERIGQVYLSDIAVYAVLVLSGIFVSVEMFPKVVMYVVWCLPTWHAVEIVRPLFAGQVLEASRMALHAGVLVLQGLVAYVVALRMLQRRIYE